MDTKDTDTEMVDVEEEEFRKEVPSDVGADSVGSHRRHYESALTDHSPLPLDCCGIVADFLVFNYLKKGDLIDARWSSDSRWWVGLVVKVGLRDGSQLLEIHYLGWSTRWREWFSRDCDDIQPFGTRTKGHMRVGSLVREYGAQAIDPLKMPTGHELLFEDSLCTMTGKDQECVPAHVRLYFGAKKMTWVPVARGDGRFKKMYKSDDWICGCGHRNTNRPTFYCTNCGCSYHATLPLPRRRRLPPVA